MSHVCGIYVTCMSHVCHMYATYISNVGIWDPFTACLHICHIYVWHICGMYVLTLCRSYVKYMWNIFYIQSPPKRLDPQITISILSHQLNWREQEKCIHILNQSIKYNACLLTCSFLTCLLFKMCSSCFPRAVNLILAT